MIRGLYRSFSDAVSVSRVLLDMERTRDIAEASRRLKVYMGPIVRFLLERCHTYLMESFARIRKRPELALKEKNQSQSVSRNA